jgi:hypothetical protein
VSDAQAYPNRSDLRNPANRVARRAAPGQTYGEAGRQLASQQAVPMAAPPTEIASQRPRIQPGSMGGLTRPTDRPEEPLTAGAPFGAGRTPTRAMMVPRRNDPVLDELRALYAAYPSEELADMLDSYVREGY